MMVIKMIENMRKNERQHIILRWFGRVERKSKVSGHWKMGTPKLSWMCNSLPRRQLDACAADSNAILWHDYFTTSAG